MAGGSRLERVVYKKKDGTMPDENAGEKCLRLKIQIPE